MTTTVGRDAGPPCYCGAMPSEQDSWPIPEVVHGGVFSRCPRCQVRWEAMERDGVILPVNEPPPAIDDITCARTAIVEAFATQLPRMGAQLIAIVAQIERVLRATREDTAVPMPESWVVPTSDLLRLVGAALDNDGFQLLARAVDALVESQALAAVMPSGDDIPSHFGTTRVPPDAFRKIIERDTAPAPSGGLEHGMVATVVSFGDMAHGTKVHVDSFEGVLPEEILSQIRRTAADEDAEFDGGDDEPSEPRS